MNIRDRIAARRAERIAREGHAFGAAVPAGRELPLVPFGRPPFLIAEMKRRSPSRGDIAAGVDPVRQAGAYRTGGVRSVSVLTEEDHFSGSLADLMAVKRAWPDLAVLRKDFLLDETDIDVSYRAGADAVLLIASLLNEDSLTRMAGRAAALGMASLVEVHSRADVAKARLLKPEFTGINARDLETFVIDPLLPLRTAGAIDWPTRLVYESGIFYGEDAAVAVSSGFSGILVGEALMKRPELCGELVRTLESDAPDFWGRLCARQVRRPGPLVKICGLTNREDAEAALSCGADVLGFILADSPRRTDAAFVKSLADLEALKVVVVVTGPEARTEPAVQELLAGGFIQAVQFHGDEEPECCQAGAFPYYKAVRLKDPAAAALVGRYRSPRVLVDAFSPVARGGTGRTIDPELVEKVREHGPLWLAGGIGPANVADMITRFRPELIDALSGLESAPGKKNPTLLKTFFDNIRQASERDL
jgi:indole-3-glycerol phosphate synthase / phosphoribosylanthranilate isomerase